MGLRVAEYNFSHTFSNAFHHNHAHGIIVHAMVHTVHSIHHNDDFFGCSAEVLLSIANFNAALALSGDSQSFNILLNASFSLGVASAL